MKRATASRGAYAILVALPPLPLGYPAEWAIASHASVRGVLCQREAWALGQAYSKNGTQGKRSEGSRSGTRGGYGSSAMFKAASRVDWEVAFIQKAKGNVRLRSSTE